MSTQSVLDMMTAGVVDRKVNAGAKLTPVGLEAPRPPRPLGTTTASYPNDQPHDAILQSLSVIEALYEKLAAHDEKIMVLMDQVRTEYAGLRVTIDLVKAELGEAPGSDSRPAPDPQREKERAADARLAAATVEPEPEEEDVPDPKVTGLLAHMDQKIAEAQAAIFRDADGWHCSSHGQAIVKTSRLGRKYRACPVDGCKEFEKL